MQLAGLVFAEVFAFDCRRAGHSDDLELVVRR